MSPIAKEGCRLVAITILDPLRDALDARLSVAADMFAVVGAVVIGRDPRQVVLERYREAQK